MARAVWSGAGDKGEVIGNMYKRLHIKISRGCDYGRKKEKKRAH